MGDVFRMMWRLFSASLCVTMMIAVAVPDDWELSVHNDETFRSVVALLLIVLVSRPTHPFGEPKPPA